MVLGRGLGFSLEQIETFVAVAEQGSFSAAARQLGLAQPGVSALMQKLEGRMGYDLFDRSTYRPRLSSEGKAFLPFARRLMAEAHSAAVAARTIREPDQRLHLSIDAACPNGIVMGALDRLRQEYPGLQLTVFGDILDRITDRVCSGECEVALASSFAELPSELNRIAAGSTNFCIAASAGHPLAQAGPVELDALKEEVQIVLMDHSGRIASRDFGIIGQRIWRAGDHSTLRAMLLAGFGYAVIPDHLFVADFGEGRLRRLSATPPFLQQSASSPCYLIWRGDGQLSPVAERFVALVAQEVDG